MPCRYIKIIHLDETSDHDFCHVESYAFRKILCFFSTWGRVWVHHLSLSSGHHQNSDGGWLSCPIPWSIKAVNSVYPEFIIIHSFAFIYICQQIEKTGSVTTGMAMGSGGHCLLLFRWWPEVKLRWGTQTLPQLYRIHENITELFGALQFIKIQDQHTDSIGHVTLICSNHLFDTLEPFFVMCCCWLDPFFMHL